MNTGQSIPLGLSAEGINYSIQLNEGVFTVDSSEKSYRFNKLKSLYLFIKNILKNDERIIYRLGYENDCYIESTKYPILEVLNDFIDLIGEIHNK